MQVPQPEKRICDQCQNSMALNLFKLNSMKCRYCQDGLSVPTRLIDQTNNISKINENEIHSIQESDDIDLVQVDLQNSELNRETLEDSITEI